MRCWLHCKKLGEEMSERKYRMFSIGQHKNEDLDWWRCKQKRKRNKKSVSNEGKIEKHEERKKERMAEDRDRKRKKEKRF